MNQRAGCEKLTLRILTGASRSKALLRDVLPLVYPLTAEADVMCWRSIVIAYAVPVLKKHRNVKSIKTTLSDPRL